MYLCDIFEGSDDWLLVEPLVDWRDEKGGGFNAKAVNVIILNP